MFFGNTLKSRLLNLQILAPLILMLSVVLSACGDTATSSAPPPTTANTSANTTTTTSSGNSKTAVVTMLPTFTPSHAVTGSVPPTLAALTPTAASATTVASSNAPVDLSDGQTKCGKIPYYVAPKFNGNGEPTSPIYAAIGASDTVGTGSSNPQTDSWDAQLAKMFPQNYQFLRLGIGGITLDKANQCLLPMALAAEPTIVTDWNVVNDIVLGRTTSQYQSDLEYFLQEVTQRTQAKILIGNVPNLSALPFVQRIAGTRYNLDDLAKQWNDVIAAEVAKYPGRVYLVNLQRNLSSLQQHPEWVSGDGLHPTTAGYTQIAQAFYDVAKQNNIVK